MYININKALENIYGEVDSKVNSLIEKGIQPKAVIIRVDGDPASEIYIRSKVNACKNHNIDSKVITLPNDVTMDKLLNTIEELNIDDTVHGFMLQLPIPEHLDSEVAINKIAPSKDIDCLTKANLGNLFNGDTSLAPCTPAGIISILESNNIEIEGKDVLIINRSMLVGIPLARLLTCKNATVTIAASPSGIAATARLTPSKNISVISFPLTIPIIVTREHITRHTATRILPKESSFLFKGDLSSSIFWIRFAILPISVFIPIVLTLNKPFPFTTVVPINPLLLFFLSASLLTPTDSPVRRDSSTTIPELSTKKPSAGILSPASNITTSRFGSTGMVLTSTCPFVFISTMVKDFFCACSSKEYFKGDPL